MAKDFRKKTFGKVLRGYAPEEVDEYLAYINEEYRKIERKAADYERKLALALKKLDEQAESQAESNAEQAEAQRKADEAYMLAVHEAETLLSEAENAAVSIREAAAAEAEKHLTEAEAAARNIIESADADAKKAKEKAAGMYDAASEMYDEVCSFRDTLFTLYSTHIESVESIASSAKEYIGRVDAGYSEALGETVSHDEDEDEIEPDEEELDSENGDDGDETEISAEETADEFKEPAGVSRDIYIDLEDDEYAEDADDIFIEDETPCDEPLYADDHAEDDDGAMTRVLRLSAISEAIAAGVSDDEYEDFSEDDFTEDDYPEDSSEEDYSSDESDEGEYSDEIEAPADFEDARTAFREMDSLFTSEPNHELSLTDEFDIVFAGADSKRNVDEIRRQPIVPAEEPKKPKKHKKF